MLWERRLEDAFNLRGLRFTPDGAALICAHVVRREFPVSRLNIESGCEPYRNAATRYELGLGASLSRNTTAWTRASPWSRSVFESP